VLAFLQSRQGLLDGVVFSGGEPTLQAALPAALAEVRAMGFATALHTGGMYPERLRPCCPCSTGWGWTSKARCACWSRLLRWGPH
jgi:pyruvate formate lyase activating enzyme